MGAAVSAMFGATFAIEDKLPIAILGDYAFVMNDGTVVSNFIKHNKPGIFFVLDNAGCKILFYILLHG
jgi:TPP-dependent 2-oxoacid decarboxylase